MMKWFVVTIIMFLSGCAGAQVPTPLTFNRHSPVAVGLKSYMTVLPQTGFTSSLNTSHGSLSGGPILKGSNVSQWFGEMKLDGNVPQYIDINPPEAYDFPDQTATFVIAVNKLVDSTGARYLISKRTSTPARSGYFCRIAPTTGLLTCRITGTAATLTVERSNVNTNFYDGKRHSLMVVFTFNTSSVGGNNIELWVDGKVDQGSLTSGSNPYEICSTCPLRIGAISETPAVAAVTGAIGSVMLWNRRLSPAYAVGLSRCGSAKCGYLFERDISRGAQVVVDVPAIND